jgi:2-amino-4-hydroxy-6-hydroxymethyldihydropteridine diphosphokinase
MAWEMLGNERDIKCLQLSSPYVSAPVDMHSQHWFTNAVGELRTSLSPQKLLQKMLAVEETLGRVRDAQAFGFQDRTIDLDLLYYGNYELDEPDLVLPHPHLYDRLFVLRPMAEIAPDFLDCKRGLSMRELEAQLCERIEKGDGRGQEIRRSTWPEQSAGQ